MQTMPSLIFFEYALRVEFKNENSFYHALHFFGVDIGLFRVSVGQILDVSDVSQIRIKFVALIVSLLLCEI